MIDDEIRVRVAWRRTPIRRMIDIHGGRYLDPEPVRYAWLEPVAERKTIHSGWVAFDHLQSPRGIALWFKTGLLWEGKH